MAASHGGCASAGTPLKPALHKLHVYSALSAASTRNTLSDAERTVILHKRQLAEVKRRERFCAELASPLDPLQSQSQSKCGTRIPVHGAEEVRGSAGSAEAALKAVKAPQVAGRKNWLTALGADVKQKQGRRQMGSGRDATLPQGVAASQTSGKLSFTVMYKYHEVLSRLCACSLDITALETR
jgi:hypothetical protein